MHLRVLQRAFGGGSAADVSPKNTFSVYHPPLTHPRRRLRHGTTTKLQSTLAEFRTDRSTAVHEGSHVQTLLQIVVLLDVWLGGFADVLQWSEISFQSIYQLITLSNQETRFLCDVEAFWHSAPEGWATEICGRTSLLAPLHLFFLLKSFIFLLLKPSTYSSKLNKLHAFVLSLWLLLSQLGWHQY
jgi:hypothetical protein